MSTYPLVAGLLVGAILASSAATTLADSPEAIAPTGTTVLVNGGEGTQTDPHVSGSVVSYTSIVNSSSEIRYQDLTVGAGGDGAIPHGVGEHDALSDISGDVIVFRRLDGTSTRRIMMYDISNGGPSVELAPAEGSRRGFAAVGGDTVAFQEFDPTTNSIADICVASIADPSTPADCLTGDGMLNRQAAVSGDGNTVAFSKCGGTGLGCDVYVATRADADSPWDAPRLIAASTGEDVLPDTNGTIVTYATNVAGDYDVRFVNVDGTGDEQVALPDGLAGSEHNPNISDNLIGFERTLTGETNADLYAYDLAADVFYRLTDTPTIDETLNDIAVSADGSVRVVWAANHGTTSGTDVYAFTFQLAPGLKYVLCPLFDQTRAFRLGSTAPIKLQLCDSGGNNQSSDALALTVSGLIKLDNSSTTALAEDAGSANPDSAFRYDAELEGYIYNLSTKGLSQGTWEMRFTVSGDSHGYAVAFDLR